MAIAVTSPGRQASNAAQLISRLEHEASHAVAVLSGEEEARLAWDGALSRFGSSEGSLLVCDVGGGSTELAFGLPGNGPHWHRSIDIGSLRLASRMLVNGGRGKKQSAAAHAEVERLFEGLLLPLPVRAIAVGGSARAIGKIAGESLGARAAFADASRSPAYACPSHHQPVRDRRRPNSHCYRRRAHPGRAPAADRRAVRGRRGGRARRARTITARAAIRGVRVSLRVCRGSGSSRSSAPSRRLAGRRYRAVRSTSARRRCS